VVDGTPRTARHGIPPEVRQLLDASGEAEVDRAWGEFLSAFQKLILFVVRSTEHDYDLAMDRFAYVLEHLRENGFRRLRTFRTSGNAKFTTWLVVVIRRLVIDHQRGLYGRVSNEEAEGDRASQGHRRRLVDLVSCSDDVSDLADHEAGDLGRELQMEETLRALSEALAALSTRERLLLTLRFEDEMSAREIGDVMGFPSPFHVYRRLRKTLGKLKEELEDRGIDEAMV
jgi:RNA polymerase sigma factor (sigma-70 family)